MAPESVAEPEVHRRAWPQVLAIAAVAGLPIVVALIRALGRHWLPLGDNGLVALRAQDVFSADTPLLGLASSAGVASGTLVNHPGPLLFDVLAVPVFAFGQPAGTAIGIALLNLAAVLTVVWAAERRLGLPGALIGGAVAATLAWSMGSELLYDPWQPHALVLSFLAFLVVAWCVGAGDVGLLPLAVGIGSLLVQSHLTYTYLVPSLLVVAGLFGCLACRGLRPVRRDVALAAVVGAVAWMQPVIEQLTARDGNLARLMRAAGEQPDAVVGARGATRLVGEVIVRPPFWLRSSFTTTFAPPGQRLGALAPDVEATGAMRFGLALVLLGLVVVALAAIAILARRRGHQSLVAMAAIAVTALGVGWFTASKVTTDLVGVAPHQFRFLWPIAAFVTMVGVVAVVTLRPGVVRAASFTSGVVLAVVVVWALPFSAAASGPQLEQWSIPALRDLQGQLDAVEFDGPVLLEWSELTFLEPYSGALTAVLRDQGVEIVTDDPVMVHQLGPDRRNRRPRAEVKVFYREGPTAQSARLGPFTRIAFHDGLDAAEHRRLARLEREIGRELGARGVQIGERLVAAQDAGYFRELRGTYPDEASIRRVFASGALWRAITEGLVDAPARWSARFDEYAHLAQQAERETVGVYLGPTDAPAP